MAQEEIFETDLRLDAESRIYLREAAKWARFLGILGFIGSGIILIATFFIWYSSSQLFGQISNNRSGFASLGVGGLVIFYPILAVVSFLVALFTFRFGQRTYRALLTDSQVDFRSGMSNLRLIFRLYGILAIIYLGFIALGILIGIVS